MARGLLDGGCVNQPRLVELAMTPIEFHKPAFTQVPSSESESGSSSERGSVLIGDDNEAFRESLADVLLDEGFEVIKAQTGTEVVQAVNELAKRLRLLLLDVRMPTLSGLEAYRRCVMGDQAKSLVAPVVFLTTGPTQELKHEARSLGAIAVLDKLHLELAQLRRLVFALTQQSPLGELVCLLLDPAAALRQFQPLGQPPAPIRRGMPIKPKSPEPSEPLEEPPIEEF